jgi:GH43 family beta-xylosidase
MQDIIGTNLIVFVTIVLGANSILIPQSVNKYPQNPVYSGSLADPFAFEADGIYYMTGTGSDYDPTKKSSTFASLISNDSITWKYVGNILVLPTQDNNITNYWAPEIAEKDNVFYLYYAAGTADGLFRLRVAPSTSPLGPYYDSEAIDLTDVTKISLAIDPHPFYDPKDGQWYLFYSRTYYDTTGGYAPGSSIAVDRLITMTQLAGNETIILRPKYDWEIYDWTSSMSNISQFHIMEGPATWMEEWGSYVCFFSGGNWQDASYGVDYAIASSPMGPYTENPTTKPRILHSIDGIVTGPGHNSIIRGLGKQTTYIVYHAWNGNTRSPYISPLNWKSNSSTNLNSGQDLLFVTLVFLVYIIDFF